MSSSFTSGYALLIGVGQSAWADWSLPITVKDVEVLKTVLISPNLCGYPEDNIRLLTNNNATRQAILENLQWLQQQAASDSNATIIVYYSGHGWLNRANNSYYLVQNDIKPFNMASSALAAENFIQALQQIQAQRLLVIIDSCHAEGMATSKDLPTLELPEGFKAIAPSKDLFSPLTQGKGRAVFTSCAGEQQSWIRKDKTMSIFTAHLIEALSGAANQPGEATVNVSNLMNHLGKTVSETAQAEWQASQIPQFDFKTEDFAIALLQGGKGLPDGGWDAIKDMPMEASRVQVQASGDRSVAIGGNASGATMITGDRNVVGSGNVIQQGKFNFNAQQASQINIGDTIYLEKTNDANDKQSDQ